MRLFLLFGLRVGVGIRAPDIPQNKASKRVVLLGHQAIIPQSHSRADKIEAPDT